VERSSAGTPSLDVHVRVGHGDSPVTQCQHKSQPPVLPLCWATGDNLVQPLCLLGHGRLWALVPRCPRHGGDREDWRSSAEGSLEELAWREGGPGRAMWDRAGGSLCSCLTSSLGLHPQGLVPSLLPQKLVPRPWHRLDAAGPVRRPPGPPCVVFAPAWIEGAPSVRVHVHTPMCALPLSGDLGHAEPRCSWSVEWPPRRWPRPPQKSPSQVLSLPGHSAWSLLFFLPVLGFELRALHLEPLHQPFWVFFFVMSFLEMGSQVNYLPRLSTPSAAELSCTLAARTPEMP
jgi:hypothetical protein